MPIYSIKPTLKKVSKYENKFAKLQKKAGEFNFRQQLKAVTKKEYTMEEEGAGVSKIMFCYQEHSCNTNYVFSGARKFWERIKDMTTSLCSNLAEEARLGNPNVDWRGTSFSEESEEGG